MNSEPYKFNGKAYFFKLRSEHENTQLHKLQLKAILWSRNLLMIYFTQFSTLEIYKDHIITCTNEFIRWFHQSRIPSVNKKFFDKYLLWFLFQMTNWEKKDSLGRIRSVFSFSNAQTDKICWKNKWTKLVKTSDEFVIQHETYPCGKSQP